ncbi:MAG TPA: carboxypeptidase-like regulatory domain-containing protein [Planctomycetota bacterium]|nr:carboxypeptidase-like regulatory domain-containing protein [Planctomycetota bacterium]
MKSKVSPLALGGVFASCAAVLLLVGWWAFSTPQPLDDSATNIAGGPTSSSTATPADVAPPAAADDPEGLDGARVALADGVQEQAKPQVEFELRASDERPLSGARTLLRRGEEVFGMHASDASGVASFEARDGRGELIVLAKDIPASVHEVSLAAGRQRIVFERGTAVSGRVRVAQDGSLGGIELVLTSDRPLVDDSLWSAEVKRALDLDDRDKLRLVTHTNDAGEFEFTGLGTPWSGNLRPGDTHELLAVTGGIWSEGADSIRLDDPAEGLVLDLAALELARGRVVATAGGAGVPRASIGATLEFEPRAGEDEGATATVDGQAGSDGSFALPIHRRSGFDPKDPVTGNVWPSLRNVTMTLDGGEDVPRRRLELSGSQLPERFDFGELVLERGATLKFLACDAQGRPLAKAVGRLDGERSEPTDENGRSSIVYAPGTGRPLTVALDGYRDARVSLPGEMPETLNVTLERTNRLTVNVHEPDGAAAGGLLVQVSNPRQGGGRNNRRRTNDQRTNDDGRAVFSDLAPATQLTVNVRDAMGASVAERAVTIAADEWSSIDLTISRALLAFSGIVRDEQGLALAEANVEFSDTQNQGRGSVSARSDADGRFRFSGLGNATGLLRVRKTGFAPLTLPEFQIPPPGVIADLRLERGLRLALRVVDKHGAPVRGDNLRLESPGERPFQGRRAGDSEWEFANLPRQAVTAIGMVGNREYRQEVEPLNGNQDFVVPVQGGLEVTVRLDPSLLQSSLRLTLRAREDRRIAPSQPLLQETLQVRTFAPVLPGTYQLIVMQLVQDEQRGANWVNVGEQQRITIAEGANQRIEIAR